MNLRRRLVLTVVVVALPLSYGAMALRHELELREAVSGLAEVAMLRMEEGGHEALLCDPERFPPPSRPISGTLPTCRLQRLHSFFFEAALP